MKLWIPAMISLLISGCNHAKTEFIDGCVSGGAPEKICHCIYDNLEEKHGSEALETINNDPYSHYPQSAEIIEDMLEYTKQCLGIKE